VSPNMLADPRFSDTSIRGKIPGNSFCTLLRLRLHRERGYLLCRQGIIKMNLNRLKVIAATKTWGKKRL